ncbi:hypothetical protein BRDID11002_18140 [Bradyrhizobium diazoefficiens]
MDTSSTIAMFLHFGLLGIGCLAIAEKFIPLFPSYVLLMLLGLTVSDGASLAMTIVATSVGSVVGALGWYGLGRALGSQRIERLVRTYGKYVLLRPSFYQQLTDAYRGNHFWVTLIGQTLRPCGSIWRCRPACCNWSRAPSSPPPQSAP